ncbi:Uncharacterized protein PBTT_03398 [Plasmodiophora brassicae]
MAKEWFLKVDGKHTFAKTPEALRFYYSKFAKVRNRERSELVDISGRQQLRLSLGISSDDLQALIPLPSDHQSVLDTVIDGSRSNRQLEPPPIPIVPSIHIEGHTPPTVVPLEPVSVPRPQRKSRACRSRLVDGSVCNRVGCPGARRRKECTNPLASSELLNALLPDIANDGATVAPGIPCILSTRAIIVDSAKVVEHVNRISDDSNPVTAVALLRG